MTLPSDQESLGTRDARGGSAEVDMKASSHDLSDDDVDMGLLSVFNKETTPVSTVSETRDTKPKANDSNGTQENVVIALDDEPAPTTPTERGEPMDEDGQIQEKEPEVEEKEDHGNEEERENEEKEQALAANDGEKVLPTQDESENDDDTEFQDAHAETEADDGDKDDQMDIKLKEQQGDTDFNEPQKVTGPESDSKDKDHPHEVGIRDSQSPTRASRRSATARSISYIETDLDMIKKNRKLNDSDNDDDSDTPLPSTKRGRGSVSRTTRQTKRVSYSPPARMNKRQRNETVHTSREKQNIVVRVEPIDYDEDDDDDDDDDTDKFEVEGIIQHRIYRNRVTRYLVKWKGYHEAESTWEPAKVLQEQPEVVTKYWDDQPKEMQRPHNLPMVALDRGSPLPSTAQDDDDDAFDIDANEHRIKQEAYGDDKDDEAHFAVGGSYTSNNTYYKLAKENRISKKDLLTPFVEKGYQIGYYARPKSINVSQDDYDIETVLPSKRGRSLLAYLNWNSGLKTVHLVDELHEGNPARLFEFYESKIRYF